VIGLVADGMGGAVAGEEASRLTVEAVQADFLGEARGSETLRELDEDEIATKLRNAVRRANHAVIQRAIEHPEYQGMGTTITLAFVRDRRVVVAHVGDSRAYLVDAREGWINQITDDHSFVEALVVSGHITAEQAAAHPMRNVLYRALGQVEDTEPDIYKRNLSEGDRLILCSDGLTRHVTQTDLHEIASETDDPDAIAERLVSLANERGGEDNISAVVILLERAENVETEDPPDPVAFHDTDIGLFQAPVPDDPGEIDLSTRELPAIRPGDMPPSDPQDEASDT
jgi:protein phosphatase